MADDIPQDERRDPEPEVTTQRVRPIVYAHRGAQGYLPENTLPAFDLAFDLGADAIECDVQRSRDGALVIIHDGTVDRTTNGAGLVSSLTLSQLRHLNAGVRKGMLAGIPTLEQTLALVRARGGGLNLEVKGESDEEAIGTARAVVPVLAALPAEERARILVSSFTLPAVAEVKRLLPDQRIGALYTGTFARWSDLIAPARMMGAEAIHPGSRLVTRGLIARAHAAGLHVNIWTTNLPATIRRFLAWGADGLFSDYPERVIIERALLGMTNARQPPEP